jgi:hypothetical protein
MGLFLGWGRFSFSMSPLPTSFGGVEGGGAVATIGPRFHVNHGGRSYPYVALEYKRCDEREDIIVCGGVGTGGGISTTRWRQPSLRWKDYRYIIVREVFPQKKGEIRLQCRQKEQAKVQWPRGAGRIFTYRKRLRKGGRHHRGSFFAHCAKTGYKGVASSKTCSTKCAEHRKGRPSREWWRAAPLPSPKRTE